MSPNPSGPQEVLIDTVHRKCKRDNASHAKRDASDKPFGLRGEFIVCVWNLGHLIRV